MPLRMPTSLGRPVAAVVTLVGLLAVAGCGSAVPAPKEFADYVSPSGRFACEYPKDWEADGAGKPDSPNSWAKFTKGQAQIRVEADLAGSLYGDMAKSQGDGFGGDVAPPVSRIHP